MEFRLLTKRGNKPHAVAMRIPMESAIARHTLEKQRSDRVEQQALKRLVLEQEMRQEGAAAVAERQGKHMHEEEGVPDWWDLCG